VVRRADLDRVNVPPPEEFAIIHDGGASAIRPGGFVLRVVPLDQAFGGLASADLAVPVPGGFAVHVADGDDLHPLVLEEGADVIEALVARADDAQGDPVAGGDRPAEPECGAGDDRREGESGNRRPGGAAEEGTTRGARGRP